MKEVSYRSLFPNVMQIFLLTGSGFVNAKNCIYYIFRFENNMYSHLWMTNNQLISTLPQKKKKQ